MSKVADFLTEAKELIKDPNHWAQGFFAKTKDGHFVGSNDLRATCWCSLGAITKTGSRSGVPDFDLIAYAEDILDQVMCGDIAEYNDGHTHAEVMEAWDEAIKLAIEKESK